MDELLKNFIYSSVYRKDFIKRKFEKSIPYVAKQEFVDPINEGFKNYLELSGKDLGKFEEVGDTYLEKIRSSKKKIGKIYFGDPLDHITIKGDRLLEGKSVYQVEYCDVEADIRKKLLETENKKLNLPEGWIIPVTTQKYDFRDPSLLSKSATKPPSMLKPLENLGQNEKVNKILNVKTGESEYNETIGNLGEFIIVEQMHGPISKPE